MNRIGHIMLSSASFLAIIVSCAKIDDVPVPGGKDQKQNIDFDIMVTREGKVVERARSGRMTKSLVEDNDNIATMDTDIPFGLVAIDYENGELLLDNAAVKSNGKGYTGSFDSYLWSASQKVTFSAYYPHVDALNYSSGFETYSIPYSVEETKAGPLVSKTVEKAVNQLNMIPLVFQHITNDIGYKICDVTPDPQLQGLIHLRKLVAHNVAQAGVFINDVLGNSGTWHRQGFYRQVVVFEGDAVVGVGSENEKFVGYDTLEDRLADSHRFYSIPDEILIGKQYVEVIYDVDGFEIGGFKYEPLKDQVAKFMIYGLLPDNIFVYGKQYTFHIGLDLSKVFKEISFSASVSNWETSIYENNDDF